MECELLPAANEVCEGYVFTDVCLSTGGSLSEGGFCPEGGSLSRGVSVTETPHTLTSGRHASYWKAFLCF